MHEFIPHLIELRKRLIRIAVVLLLVFGAFFYIDEQLYRWIAKPLLEHLPQGAHLVAVDVTSSFTVPMKLAFILSIFLAAPYCLFEIWSFIAPGLYRKEKQTILPFLVASVLLFYFGIAFSFVVICPITLKFFVNAAPIDVTLMTDIRSYLEFILTLLFAGGVAFQVPVITLALIRFRIVSTTLFTHLRPYIIVLAFVLGMLLTPPDVLSQILVAVPMWGLFELGLLFGKRFEEVRR